jgi:beta-lactamase class A
LRLDQAIELQPQDIVTQISPIAEEYARGQHTYSVRELVTRMLQDSDNTAADVLYRVLGGSQALNDSLGAIGIDGIVFRTDEAGLVADAKAGRTFDLGGDNAGSPASIATLLADLAQGRVLSTESRTQLRSILSGVNTFPGRLRAGFPPDTHIEHKTGTSSTIAGITDATNDVGIVTVNGRTIVVVAMLHGARGTDAARDAILASVARVAYDATRLFPTQ